MREKLLSSSSACKTKDDVETIARTVAQGGIIVFPTDTTYGIGCNPFDKMAVQKIYDIKQRVKTKEMPVLGFSKKDIKIIAEFNTTAEKIATRYWPGKITLVLKLKDLRLQESLGVTKSIAVRVPNNDCALSILEKCRLLVGTSANVSGTKPFVDPKDGLENINGYDIFVDGGIIQSDGKSSTILDCTTDEIIILREGAIKFQEIKRRYFESDYNMPQTF